MLSDWCLGFLIKILLKSVVIISLSRQCFVNFVYFLKFYVATHISQTKGSFNSVVVIIVVSLILKHVALPVIHTS